MRTLAEWIAEANAEMLRVYGIDLNDGPDDDEIERYAKEYPNPVDFVEWWGSKYDLEPLDDAPWLKALRAHQQR